jgi:hypothetical protein
MILIALLTFALNFSNTVTVPSCVTGCPFCDCCRDRDCSPGCCDCDGVSRGTPRPAISVKSICCDGTCDNCGANCEVCDQACAVTRKTLR